MQEVGKEDQARIKSQVGQLAWWLGWLDVYLSTCVGVRKGSLLAVPRLLLSQTTY